MRTLLEFLLIRLVAKPEALKIEEHDDMGQLVYTIIVDPEDAGRVIGRGGKIIKAIRKIASIFQVKNNIHARIVIEG